jgi:hypothetical protein
MVLISKRRNGIYYTPSDLADYLIKPLINNFGLTVFDPAYGEGSLLLSAERISSEKFLQRKSIKLFGCDKLPKDGLLTHLANENFVKKDFFYFSGGKFDVIISNPPFVRHHLQSNTKRQIYNAKVQSICRLGFATDLWGYFLIKSTSHLKTGGNMGFILPWSFLQADYSIPIREFLLENFNRIKLVALDSEYFSNAEERIILLWLFDYGKENKSIEMAYSKNIDQKMKYKKIDKYIWLSRRLSISNNFSIQKIIEELASKYNYKRFDQIAQTKIGVVTGADDYFILNEDQVVERKLDKRKLQPIFSSLKKVNGFETNGTISKQYLLKINQKNFRNYIGFIRNYKENSVHLRAHSLRRIPWYTVKTGKIPDAFFPYRISRCPYLIWNKKKYQSTNSVHRIYLKVKLSTREMKCLQLSFLTYPTQLSIESNSKIYGSGVLKIEPSSLDSAIMIR